jgi:hypothetical protein
MAKPILVINYCVDGMPMDKAVRNLRELQKIVSESNANDEYYTFLLPVTVDSHVQVFYDKNQNEIQYEELKGMIEEKMKNFENKPNSNIIEFEEFDEDFNYGEWSTLEKIKNFFYKLFKR